METFHKVINADCYEAIKNIPDNSIDLFIMDPPYDIAIKGAGIVKDHKNTRVAKKMDSLSGIETGFDFSIFSECLRCLKVLNLYVFCSTKQIKPILNFFDGAYIDILTWHKTNPMPLFNAAYLPDTEYVVFIRNGGAPWYGQFKTTSKYYISNNAKKAKYNHPTIKPEELIERFILNSSKEGDTILDPFAGSGTTAECAKRLGRNSISIEIERKYCDIIERRIEPDIKIKTLPLFQDVE